MWFQQTHLATPWSSRLAGQPYLCISHFRSYPGDSHHSWLILFIENSNYHKWPPRNWIHTHEYFFFRDESKADLFSTSELIPSRDNLCWVKDGRGIHDLPNRSLICSDSCTNKFCGQSSSKKSFKQDPAQGKIHLTVPVSRSSCQEIRIPFYI